MFLDGRVYESNSVTVPVQKSIRDSHQTFTADKLYYPRDHSHDPVLAAFETVLLIRPLLLISASTPPHYLHIYASQHPTPINEVLLYNKSNRNTISLSSS